MRTLLLAALVGCGEPAPTPEAAPEEAAVAVPTELAEAWKAREERLASESGWLTLVALTWLDEGAATIGSDPSSHVVLPEWSAPAQIATLTREGTAVTLQPAAGAELSIEGEPVTTPTLLLHDGEEAGPTVVTRGTLSFYVIERQGKIGIRAKDSAHPDRTSFAGIPRFDPDASWAVEATLVPFDAPRKVSFPTAIGTTDEATVPGEVRFSHGGQDYALLPFQDAPEDPLFFVFGDKSNGTDTYGGGRFLSTEAPVDGVVTLDFNLATNPPCAFTPFATCPLPPAENKLAVRVEAGEKVPAGH